MEIRPARADDIPQIQEIYNHYIRHTTITFEEEALTLAQMQARVEAVTQRLPWLVGTEGDQVLGYAYANRWKERAAYRHTVEATIYLRDGCGGQGRGRALYGALLGKLEQMGGFHVVLGCIAVPNEASVALHERLGFRQVAHFTEVGFKHGRWLDVGYWQRLLDPHQEIPGLSGA